MYTLDLAIKGIWEKESFQSIMKRLICELEVLRINSRFEVFDIYQMPDLDKLRQVENEPMELRLIMVHKKDTTIRKVAKYFEDFVKKQMSSDITLTSYTNIKWPMSRKASMYLFAKYKMVSTSVTEAKANKQPDVFTPQSTEMVSLGDYFDDLLKYKEKEVATNEKREREEYGRSHSLEQVDIEESVFDDNNNTALGRYAASLRRACEGLEEYNPIKAYCESIIKMAAEEAARTCRWVYSDAQFLAHKNIMEEVEDIFQRGFDKGYAEGKKTRDEEELDSKDESQACEEAEELKPFGEPGEALKQLNKMIGLKNVKKVVKSFLAEYHYKNACEQLNHQLANWKQDKHMCFLGNPGTAKTTVARLLTHILADEGVIQRRVLVECGRADLVEKYIGQTAPKVRAKFSEAKGGVLFIDEAYALAGDGRDFGPEAITTIVQEMEYHRDDVVVIFAGYPDLMQKFLDVNNGLRSRISYYLYFNDYSPIELLDIFKMMAKDNDIVVTPMVENKVYEILKMAVHETDFGNGRFVRKMFSNAVTSMALRLDDEQQYTKETISTFTEGDFQEFWLERIHHLQRHQIEKPTIGFQIH